MGWLDGVFGDCLWVLWRDENPMKTKMELLSVSPLTRPTLQDFVYTEHEISGSSMCFTGPSLRLNVGFLSMLCWNIYGGTSRYHAQHEYVQC